MSGLRKVNFVWTGVLILIFVLSITVIYQSVSSDSFQSRTIRSLDDKKTTVLELTASATAASTAISIIPGDAGTPIAEKLADLSGYFLIIFCAIYFEKYLFTISGFLAFRILIPVACIFMIAWLWTSWNSIKKFASKLFAFGLILFCIIPASMWASDYIEKAYETSYQETIESAKESSSEVKNSTSQDEEVTDADSTAGSGSETGSSDSEAENKNWWDKLVGKVEKGVTGSVTNITDQFDNLLSRFIDAIAVLIVTSCLIPIAVLVIFIYITKLLLGISRDINFASIPKGSQFMRDVRGRTRKKED